MNDAYNTSPAENAGEVTLPQNYQPNADELKLLAQCRTESNLKGFLGSALGGGLVYQCIKSFNLSVSPKYGVWPKVGSACMFGFFLGKLLSIPSCYEKFKNLPNSPLGAYMRQKRASRGESLPIEAPDTNLNFAVINPSKYADDGPMNSAIDIDVYNSPSNMDSYTGDELNGPGSDGSNDNLPNQNYVEKPSLSYAELRRRNREDYMRAEKEKYNLPSSVPNDTPAAAAQPTRRSAPPPPLVKKNQYGDVWE